MTLIHRTTFIKSLFMLLSVSTLSQNVIDEKKFMEILTSEVMRGRMFGSEGEKRAATYLESKMRQLHLVPKGDSSYLQPYTATLNNTPFHHANTTIDTSLKTSQNVIGFIDNPNTEQIIIIGAHYDHLGTGHGIGSMDSLKTTHPGADDNASGVLTLFYLAQYFAQHKLDTDLLFIAFSGEEQGLYGSSYFCKKPTVELSRVIAMLNYDMVGRMENKALAIFGSGTSPSWNALLSKANSDSLTIQLKPEGIGPSDHSSFYLKNIPSLHFFTGQHEDYHRTTDTPDKINYHGIALILDYSIRLIKEIAKTDSLKFQKTKNTIQKASKFKVTMGIMPNYMEKVDGLKISGVTDKRPADLSGLKVNDIITSVDHFIIHDIYDYMEVLSKHKNGDQVSVTFLRNGVEKTTSLTFK